MSKRRVVKPLNSDVISPTLEYQRKGLLAQPAKDATLSQVEAAPMTKRQMMELFLGKFPQAKNYVGKGPSYQLARQRYLEIEREMVALIAYVEQIGDSVRAHLLKEPETPLGAQEIYALQACEKFCVIFGSDAWLAKRDTKSKNAGQGYDFWLSIQNVGLLVSPVSDYSEFPFRENRPLLIPMDPHFVNHDGIDETAIRIVVDWIERKIPVRLRDSGKLPPDVVAKNNAMLAQVVQEEIDDEDLPSTDRLFGFSAPLLIDDADGDLGE